MSNLKVEFVKSDNPDITLVKIKSRTCSDIYEIATDDLYSLAGEINEILRQRDVPGAKPRTSSLPAGSPPHP